MTSNRTINIGMRCKRQQFRRELLSSFSGIVHFWHKVDPHPENKKVNGKVIKKTITISAIFACILWLNCTHTVTPDQDGKIAGRVIRSDGSGVPGLELIVFGTSFSAKTDTCGSFCFYHVPPGEYLIYKQDLTDTSPVPATVMAGRTTTLADMIFPWPISTPYNYHSYSYGMGMFGIYDAKLNTSLFHANTLFSFNNPPIILRADSVYMEFALWVQNSSPSPHSIRVIHNGRTIYDSLPDKWRVRTCAIALHNLDTFTVFQDSTLFGMVYLVDSAYVRSAIDKRLKITVSPAVFTRGVYPGRTFFAVTSDTFSISYALTAPIDWDLYLVNDSTGDSCCWKNTSPDWGEPGGNDNPFFQGDGYSFGSTSQKGVVNYNADIISSGDLADGSYSIFVRYYEGPSDSTVATPELNIELGTYSYMRQAASYGYNRYTEELQALHFWQCFPAKPLARGKVWYAGRIKLPEMSFTPGETNALPGPAAAHNGSQDNKL